MAQHERRPLLDRYSSQIIRRCGSETRFRADELRESRALAQALEPLVPIDPLPSINSMLRVIDVQPLEGYRLRIAFNDGVVRELDCSFLLRGTLGEPLRDLDYFRTVRVDDESRTIVWPNGLDPAPEILHDPDWVEKIGPEPSRSLAP